MEMDFETVKALASPTRVNILKQTMKGEPTPTEISEKVGKTKSTVASHLEQLEAAGLVEKDEEEGRRRVIYRATDKTEAIVHGRSRKVKFSILSTVSTAFIGLVLIFEGVDLSNVDQTASYTAAEAAGNTAAAPKSLIPNTAMIAGGVIFLVISAAILYYGKTISKLRNN
jgi:DNA-binding transcriptional ArsR family regulator